ncbi:MAG: BrnT family toxin [Pseudomonadota bacterium]
MKSSTYEWDEEKNLTNLQKHGVSFEQAQYAFDDPYRIIVNDLEHGEETESRFFCFGKVSDGILTVRFTYRLKRIRIYGAGYWRKGRKIYEQENKIH